MIHLACMFDGGLCILAALGFSGLVAMIGKKVCNRKDCEHKH